MSLSTKGVEASKPRVPFMFDPGTVVAKITEVRIGLFPNKKDRYFINVIIEGPEIENFEGWKRDIDDPSKGNYKGQFASVAITTYVKNTDNDQERDTKMLKAIVDFVKPLGLLDEVNEIDVDSWEEYAHKLTELFKEKNEEYYFTIGAVKKPGQYDNYHKYYFPRADYKNGKYPASLTKEDLLPFNPDSHVEKPKETEVESFESFSMFTEEETDNDVNEIFG